MTTANLKAIMEDYEKNNYRPGPTTSSVHEKKEIK